MAAEGPMPLRYTYSGISKCSIKHNTPSKPNICIIQIQPVYDISWKYMYMNSPECKSTDIKLKYIIHN